MKVNQLYKVTRPLRARRLEGDCPKVWHEVTQQNYLMPGWYVYCLCKQSVALDNFTLTLIDISTLTLYKAFGFTSDEFNHFFEEINLSRNK